MGKKLTFHTHWEWQWKAQCTSFLKVHSKINTQDWLFQWKNFLFAHSGQGHYRGISPTLSFILVVKEAFASYASGWMMELLNHVYSYQIYESAESLAIGASKSGRKGLFIQSNKKSNMSNGLTINVWEIDLEERLGMETCQKLGNTSKLVCKASLAIAKSTDSLKVKFFEKAFPEIFALFSYQFMPVSCQFSGFKLSNFAKQGIPKFHSLPKIFSPRGGAVRHKSHSSFYR